MVSDGFVKSPAAALRFTFVVAAYLECTLHSSVFARLASGAFYEPSFKWFLLNEKNEKGGKNGAPGDLKPRFTLKRKKPPFD